MTTPSPDQQHAAEASLGRIIARIEHGRGLDSSDANTLLAELERAQRSVNRLAPPAPSTGATAGGRMSGPLFDEGLLRILSAGGCRCDPPGVGEEFCTGHCHLRAEVAQLRAELAHAQAECDEEHAKHVGMRADLAQAQAEIVEARIENKNLQGDVMDSDHNELVQLRAQVQAMRGVVEAARAWANVDYGVAGELEAGAALVDALAALDQAQPNMRDASS